MNGERHDATDAVRHRRAGRSRSRCGAACGGDDVGRRTTATAAGDHRRRRPPRRRSRPARRWRRCKDEGQDHVGTKFDQPLFGLKNPTTSEVEGFDVEIGQAHRRAASSATTSRARSSSSRRRRRSGRTFIQQGKVDLVIATYTINDARKQRVDFAGPYYVAGQDILVKNDDTTIKGVDRPQRQEGLLGHGLDVADERPAEGARRPTCRSPSTSTRCASRRSSTGGSRRSPPTTSSCWASSTTTRTRSSSSASPFTDGALRHRPQEGRHGLPQLGERPARGVRRKDGSYARRGRRRRGQRASRRPTPPAARPRTSSRPTGAGRAEHRCPSSGTTSTSTG